jgi:hypothetical protein
MDAPAEPDVSNAAAPTHLIVLIHGIWGWPHQVRVRQGPRNDIGAGGTRGRGAPHGRAPSICRAAPCPAACGGGPAHPPLGTPSRPRPPPPCQWGRFMRRLAGHPAAGPCLVHASAVNAALATGDGAWGWAWLGRAGPGRGRRSPRTASLVAGSRGGLDGTQQPAHGPGGCGRPSWH